MLKMSLYDKKSHDLFAREKYYILLCSVKLKGVITHPITKRNKGTKKLVQKQVKLKARNKGLTFTILL